MTTSAKLSLKQSFLFLASVAFLLLIVLDRTFSWQWPWYLLVVFGLFSLCCGGYAVRLTDEAEKQRVLANMAGRPALNETEFGQKYFTSDKAEIAAKLRNILGSLIDIDLSQMHPHDRFIEDLRMDDLDSLSTVNFVVEIEREFDIKIPDSAAEKMTTFQSVVDYIAETVKAKEA